MSTIRVAKRSRFTTIDRRTIRDDRLSFRARGVLVWLLDKPDDWSARSEVIAAAGTEGRDAVRSALRELEALGYIVRRKHRTPDGRWAQEVIVYERPQIPGTDFQASENQASGSQALEETTDTEEREELDPPNPRRAGAQRSAGTNPRAVGTNPRAQNVDAVMTGTDTGCPLRCDHGWIDTDDGYQVPCELHPEEATA